MKKALFALMCAAAVIFAGCNKATNPLSGGTKGSSLSDQEIQKMDNKTEKCWHVAESVVVSGYSETEHHYFWGTEQEVATMVKASYDASKLMVVGDYEIAYVEETSAKNEDACDKLDREAEKNNGGDDDDPDAECWQVTYKTAGMDITLGYMWMSEEAIEEYVAALKKTSGIDYSYKKISDAKDEDSCIYYGAGGQGGGQGEGGGNEDQGELACWKLSWSFGGDSDVEYMYQYESVVKSMADTYKSLGGTASYEKTNKGEDDCEED